MRLGDGKCWFCQRHFCKECFLAHIKDNWWGLCEINKVVKEA